MDWKLINYPRYFYFIYNRVSIIVLISCWLGNLKWIELDSDFFYLIKSMVARDNINTWATATAEDRKWEYCIAHEQCYSWRPTRDIFYNTTIGRDLIKIGTRVGGGAGNRTYTGTDYRVMCHQAETSSKPVAGQDLHDLCHEESGQINSRSGTMLFDWKLLLWIYWITFRHTTISGHKSWREANMKHLP